MNHDLRIFQDLEALSHAALDLIVEEAHQAIADHGRFLLVLNGGGTPTRLFQLLGSVAPGRIDWSQVHIFWGDERLVPPDDNESNYGQARRAFLSRVHIPASNVHPIDGAIQAPKAVQQYSQTLQQFADPPRLWPRFDLVLLGMGEDGHTASLFPGLPVDTQEPVIAVTAQYQGRPAGRISLTPPVFNSARLVVFLVAGENKAGILERVLTGKVSPEQFPVQRIQPKDGRLIWLVDAAAAKELTQ